MKKWVMTGLTAGLFAALQAGALAADGKAVYESACAGCHKLMKPKTGDKAQWAPLLKEGRDALVAAVITGKGTMKPRGGKPSLSDDDVKAAVDYMISRVQ